MSLSKRYNPQKLEPEIAEAWRTAGIYAFDGDSENPLFSIDTPPPTVSGNLHLGHAYSYSQTDFIARFRRMRGYNVFYPMGFDDNGLPTERLVERTEGVRAEDIGREAFVERCLAISEELERRYAAIFSRLGLSVDWRYSYRTISRESQRLAQWSFLDLYRRGCVYRKRAPAIWCPHCHTALAQADVDDLERQTTLHTVTFRRENGEMLPIATTRPELLPACVALFVHPDDPRAAQLVGQQAIVPLFDRAVPILADPGADPQKGTGIVMCCTFGDTADVEWWYKHDLPLIEAIGASGEMLEISGSYAGLPVDEARKRIVTDLQARQLLLQQETSSQTIRVHERCDTPVEFIVSEQWFVSLLPHKELLLEAGTQIHWYPPHMESRYEQWVQNLGWDWCISRQRTFGVPFPVWICNSCAQIVTAEDEELPVDPAETQPGRPCPNCGGDAFTPEHDVMDTWATSSMSPQIAGRMFSEPDLYEKVFPFSLRPQAHEIIRNWAFYTLAKSILHFESLPWRDITISGWGLAPEGATKISKSRGGGPLGFTEAFARYSADAVRYWAASTALGKDTVIDETKIQAGTKLATKLWNVARFSQRFIAGQGANPLQSELTPADRWILSRLQKLIRRATSLMERYDYATAKSEVEQFLWSEFADNYLEMAKQRLYDGDSGADGAQASLQLTLVTVLKLLAPFMPYVTEAIYQGLWPEQGSIHRSEWPEAQDTLEDDEAERGGECLLEITTAVRRYKSESNLSLGAELERLHLIVEDEEVQGFVRLAEPDLISVTRAQRLTVGSEDVPEMQEIGGTGSMRMAIAR